MAVAIGVDHEKLVHARFGGRKTRIKVAIRGDKEFQVGQLPVRTAKGGRSIQLDRSPSYS